MVELSRHVRQAVRSFWKTRRQQRVRQQRVGAVGRDRGARAAVTGGQQMDAFIELTSDLLVESGVSADSIHIDARLELPSWFRAEKQRDLLVVYAGCLLAAVEFKSQVGPSFGNNFNNRTEEALGSAIDLWAAYREGAFKPAPRPWLGYLMLLEDCERSRMPINVREPHFKTFPEFSGASYGRRYEILIEKLLRDRIYDGACLILAESDLRADGRYLEPHPELTVERFVRSLCAHCSAAARSIRQQ